MKFNKYEIKARYFPAVLTMLIPVIIFNHFFVSEELVIFFDYIKGIKLYSNATISLVLVLYISQFGRAIGKGVFERYFFSGELNMPTTNFLLYSNSNYSDQHKFRIRKKVKKDFNINLPTREEEEEDEIACRVRIVEAMALVREMLHGNKFLLQHNIEYGMMRNAIGGGLLGFILSIVNVLFFWIIVPSTVALILSLITGTIYLVLIVLSKYIINFYGNNYAKILFREYLAN